MIQPLHRLCKTQRTSLMGFHQVLILAGWVQGNPAKGKLQHITSALLIHSPVLASAWSV